MQFDASDLDLLATTACWTAAIRAQESEREDRVFDDPWAAVLAGREGVAWMERMASDSTGGSCVSLVVRTRFFDDFLQRTVNNYPLQIKMFFAGWFADF